MLAVVGLNRPVGIAVLLVAAEAVASPCASTARSAELAPVIRCLFQPGSPYPFPGPDDLRSRDSGQAAAPTQAFPPVERTRMSGERSLRGQRYASVEVTLRTGDCLRTVTETWTRREGAWRRLVFPELREASLRART